MALTKVSYSMIDGAAVNAADYGFSPSASAIANLAAFKAAVAATPVNGTLYVPPSSSYYVIDTPNESSAININKRMTVWIDGLVRSNYGAQQADPPTLFVVSADEVTFTGTGRIRGDGGINQSNTGTIDTAPKLLKVTGDSFSMYNLTIDTPHKVGVCLYTCKYAKISNCNFTGGPTEYRDTSYFGIFCYYGEKHLINDNQFYPDENGGMFVQCVFVNSTSNVSIQDNIAEKPYEKLAYVVSNNNIISGNIIIGNTGLVPGTDQQGTVGPPIRNDGINSKITNNFIWYCGGGISAIGGGGLDISNNSLYEIGQGAIGVFAGANSYDYISIRNNICKGAALTGAAKSSGILIDAPSGSNFYFDISHNQVTGFAPDDVLATVSAWTPNTAVPYYASVKPTVYNNRYFSTVGGGVTGNVEPTWNTVVGGTTIDGTVTWVTRATDNTLSAGIRVIAPSAGNRNERCIISYNNISGLGTSAGCRVGIWTTYMADSIVSHNRLRVTTYGIRDQNGTGNRHLYNSVDAGLGASVGIVDLAATSFGEGNVYNTATPLITSVTLPAGVATLTISSSVLVAASNAKVMVSPANASAAAFVKDHGGVYATVSSPNVVLTSGDGTNFAGTEIFTVHVVQ